MNAMMSVAAASLALSGCTELGCWPACSSLVLRAGGTDTRHGNTTYIDSQRETREASNDGYGAAAAQMMQRFDAVLTNFEADVRSGKAAVQVVRKNNSVQSGGRGRVGLANRAGLVDVGQISAQRRLLRSQCRGA
jgi:rhombotail lipoprotein